MKRSLFLLSALLMAGAASAQVTDPYDVHVGDVGLLQDLRIQKDVGITAAQRVKMQAAAAAHTQRLQEYQKQLQALGMTNPDRAKLVGFLTILKNEVFAVLTPAEGHRLSQLTLQRIGLVALSDAIVGKRVGVSAAQTQKLMKVLNDGKARFVAAQSAASSPILAPYRNRKPKDQAEAAAWQKDVQGKLQAASVRLKPQLDAIGKQVDASMLAVLTPAQRTAWAQLKGAPFKAK